MSQIDLTHRVINSFDAPISVDPDGTTTISHGAAPRGILNTMIGLVLTTFFPATVLIPFPHPSQWGPECLIAIPFVAVGVVYLVLGLRDLSWVWTIAFVPHSVEYRERRFQRKPPSDLDRNAIRFVIHPAEISWSRGFWKGFVLCAHLPDRTLALSLHKDHAQVVKYAEEVKKTCGVAWGEDSETIYAQRNLW
jgi:hypothetical protein